MRWPWKRVRHLKDHRFYSRWPKKVYFLDGPLVGQTREGAGPGFEVVVPFIGYPRDNPTFADYNVQHANPTTAIQYWRYYWETCYPCAAVAYVRFIV